MLQPFVADHASALDALALLTDFGPRATGEAGARAERSRDRGNVVSFCRWRQIERLLAVMHNGAVASTHH